MDRREDDGPFTRRRTFTIGPAPQRTTTCSAAREYPSEGHGALPLHKGFARTVSAPAFTRRAVEPCAPSARQNSFSSQVRNTALEVHLPLSPLRPNRTSRTSPERPLVRRPVSSAVTMRGGRLPPPAGATHSVSPDPREPCDAPSLMSFPNVSPIPSLSWSGSAAAAKDLSLRPQAAVPVVPSIASSIHSGGLGAWNDASISPRWYPAWASPWHHCHQETAVAASVAPPVLPPSEPSGSSPHSVPSSLPSPEEKRRRRATSERRGTVASTSTPCQTPATRRGAADNTSSNGPDTLARTMPPAERKALPSTAGDVADKKCSSSWVYIRVEGCSGLPRAPFGVEWKDGEKLSEPSKASGNEVYVYMRSNHSPKRYKSASVSYATTALFPQSSNSFVLPLRVVHPSGTGHTEEDTLTFTVAVKLSTGRQVKLGVGQLALCNLLYGAPTSVPMLIVAKAGTARARERGVLQLVVEAAAPSRGVSPNARFLSDEAVVRDRILTVMRRECREKLHQVEVYVRCHCTDSAAELQRLLRSLAADPVHANTRVQPPNNVKEKSENEEKVQSGKRKTRLSTTRSSSSSSHIGDDGSSSLPAKPRERAERRAPQRSFSYTATTSAPNEKRRTTAAALLRVAGSPVEPHYPAKQEAAMMKRPCPVLPPSTGSEVHMVDAIYQRSRSAPFSSIVTRASPAHPAMRKHVRVLVQRVYGLRDEDGLPLFECGSCFVHVSVLGSTTSGPSNVCVTGQQPTTEWTTDSAVYEGDEALFPANHALLRVSSALPCSVLCCSVYHGTTEVHQKIGSCEVSLKHPSSFSSVEEKDCVLVRHAGSPQAHMCGHLRLSVTAAHWEADLSLRNNHIDDKIMRADTLQKRTLSYLWHHCRAELHRLDSVLADASAVGFDAAVAKYVPLPLTERKGPSVDFTPRNSVRVVLRAVTLMDRSVASNDGFASFNSALATPNVTRVFFGWSCGCYGGRSRTRPLDASAGTLRFSESLPVMDDVDPWRDELCFVLYGTRCNGEDDVCELCRVHVSLRSFCVCQRGSGGEKVQLPLVWHARERGAFERGHLRVDVVVTESSPCTHSIADASSSSCVFRRSQWAGFRADWPPREAVRLLLRCYATDQLHRLLPLLADAEGREEVLLTRLQSTYGPARAPVQLRVCLCGFRCLHTKYRTCHLKLYRGKDCLLRTPTIVCGATAASGHNPIWHACRDGNRNDVVPLLDEDKYLVHFSTTTPHQDTLLLHMSVEHLLRKSDVVAYAEVAVGAFVSLESRLEESMQKLPGATAALRAPLWVPLCSEENEAVAEVALRVEWVHTAPLTPVRRVTTQKKSAVTAVLRTSSGGGGAGNEVVPLVDAPTSRDLWSLLRSYLPEELCRWSWHLSRWADATTAHRKLRRELLSPRAVSTVYVDLAGISLRTSAASRLRLGTLTRGELAVSAFCLGCASPCPAHCRVLHSDAARATVQAAAVLHAIDRGADSVLAALPTLRLDVRLPTSHSDGEDFCLVFSTALRNPILSAERTRAFSAPKWGRRGNSAPHFRPPRARSAVASVHTAYGGGTVRQQRGTSVVPFRQAPSPVERKEAGRAYLSLRALLTTPELYREGEVVTIPVVALHGGGGTAARKRSTSTAVLGDVYVRVRTPTHESTPDWLRYTEDEVRCICQNGGRSRKELRSMLHQQQLHVEFAADARAEDVAEVHAAFFRKRAAPPAELMTKNCSSLSHEVPAPLPPTSVATPKLARPPFVPHQALTCPPATTSARKCNELFTIHEVFPRVSEQTSELDDLTTPQRHKSDSSLHAWTLENGGITVEQSSGSSRPTPSLRMVSAHEIHPSTKRALIF
ncbi:hypothetical protein ABB37_03910 [Leptomonas pyrrhocoris]|uniref:C2 domain-containing protein n=1 Tax=Leptomonas pyrrhocoris TaxID=157538 RepID=A0A0N0VFQ1_LEPPY|nr:hypothetical protein ABB37_03910 [Leptomonas pyrrhocoris]KPA81571.1 hypothetical protein ABB37_03910 [Leptomonas pyrrhocoris]|eukprot:XP_015660010.1 hypothetical protein ABB37_03910 [Leptomonas pyrrhocoris]